MRLRAVEEMIDVSLWTTFPCIAYLPENTVFGGEPVATAFGLGGLGLQSCSFASRKYITALVDENGTAPAARRSLWSRRAWLTVGGLLLLLIAVHRPLLLAIGKSVANHYAEKVNIKLDCRLEGSVFTGLVVRNLRIVPIGPTIVESVDIDYIRADYSLIDLMFGGLTEVLKAVEVRNANIVLNPAKASLKPDVPRPDERIRLFTIFPEQVRLSDINIYIRTDPQDFVLEHFYVDLNPTAPGELRAAKLQIPTAPAWPNLLAQTSYAKKKLILQRLVLDPENQFRLIAFDASRIRAKALEVALDSSLAGGTIAGSLGLSETATSLDLKLHFVAENVSLDTLRGYLGRPPEFLTGEVQRVAADWSGAINAPRSWEGNVSAEVANLRREQLFFDRCVLNLTAHAGVMTLQSGEATKGLNKIRLKGNAALPDDIREIGRSPASFEVSGLLPDLRSLTAGFAHPLTGAATVTGLAEIKSGTLRADLDFGGGSISAADGSVEQVKGTLRASKQMPATNERKPYYADLRSEVHVDLTTVRAGDYVIDSVHADLRTVEDLATLDRAVVVRKQNNLTVSGDYRLPEDFTQAPTQAGKLAMELSAPQLADYWASDSPNKVTGPLQVSGQIGFKDAKANGQLQIYGSNLRARNLAIPQISAQASIARNVVYLNDFSATLNAKDYAGGSGMLSLEKPYRYSGKFFANIADLSTLKPLLVAAGNQNELAGALMVDWQGSGTAADFKNSGKLKITLEKGRYASQQSLKANIDAAYSPDGLDAPTIFFASDKMDFQAIMQAKDSTLEISKIQVDQGKAKYGVGYASLPFVWKNVGTDRPLFPEDGNVLVNFQSENLDIKKLFEDFGRPAPATGLMSMKLEAHGTLADVIGRIDVQMRDLRMADLATLEPATFEMTARLEHNQLSLNGKLQQSKIQPVQITGNLPFNVAKILREKKLDENTPLTARVQMPRSSVNFLRQFLPMINQLDGDMTLDVNVNGTIAKPVLSGDGDIAINVGRFNNPTLPALSGFKSRLTFKGDTLNFERFGGDLAGGPFTVGGRVTFPKLTEPNLDFQIKADSVLVARNDSLTARADANIRVAGPLKAATVTGNVALTNSQFLKNIDLLPIGLPGRPAPQPPSDRPDFSVPQPPIRDWKFDVAVKTKDPFIIRGNLANGGAIVDLHLTGTGLHPGLEGQVRLENVEATLPFSRLEVSHGFLYFDPSDSFNPKIDLQGTSLIRDYTIHVYVSGNSLSPEAVFTSEPPLPQEEIISLLATGTTREELTGNNNVLAGRAAMLLVQQLYRKVFKKGQPTKSNSVFDRLQVDVGNVDPRTGQQSATARLKLNDQFVLIGDLGVGGDFRGMVKYLIRFK